MAEIRQMPGNDGIVSDSPDTQRDVDSVRDKIDPSLGGIYVHGNARICPLKPSDYFPLGAERLRKGQAQPSGQAGLFRFD